MGTSDYSGFQTQKSKKFYTDLSGINSNQDNKEKIVSILIEKIQLKVSIKNIKTGCEYQINLYNINRTQKNPLNEINNCILQDNKIAIMSAPILIDYYFEKEQNLLIEIVRIEKDISEEFEVETSLGCIMGSRKNSFSTNISSSENEILILEAEKFEKTQEDLNIKFEIRTNRYTSFDDVKYKMYYEIYSDKILYRSECLNDKGVFDYVKIPSVLFKDNKIKILFYNNKRKIVGNFALSIYKFINKEIFTFNLNGVNFKIISNSLLIKNYTFVDYLKAGVQIGLIIAIDFNKSNGDPNNGDSLHYIDDAYPNQYERAIYTCGNMIAYYDYDQLFPAFGFGVQIGKNSNPLFNLNFEKEPDIKLIQGVIEAYHKAVHKIKFSGQTLFAPVIQKVNKMIKQDINNFKYNVLMILTNGKIDDIDDTINELVESSFLPLSVVIIGIGCANFSQMERLDADINPLINSKGEEACRDLVQFVPFLKFEKNPEKLSDEVLAEIPKQLVEYYEQNNHIRINYLNIYQ